LVKEALRGVGFLFEVVGDAVSNKEDEGGEEEGEARPLEELLLLLLLP
jgi:hypothetical protein